MSLRETDRVINLHPREVSVKGRRTRVELVIALKRVLIPPRGFWQVKRFLACCDARVTLTAREGKFVDQEKDHTYERTRKLGLIDGRSIDENAKGSLEAGGLKAAFGHARKRDLKMTDVREWKETVATVRALRTKPHTIEWMWYASDGGPGFIEDDEDLWATAEPDDSAVTPRRFNATASAIDWGMFDSKGKRLPDLTFLGCLAKLFGREHYPPSLIAPAIIEVTAKDQGRSR